MVKPLASILMLLVLSCAEGANPRQTAEGYLRALSQLDFKSASRFVADQGRSNFDSLGRLYSSMAPEEKKKFQVENWVITSESQNGDTASIDFTFDQVKKGQLSLHRIDGVWRIDSRTSF